MERVVDVDRRVINNDSDFSNRLRPCRLSAATPPFVHNVSTKTWAVPGGNLEWLRFAASGTRRTGREIDVFECYAVGLRWVRKPSPKGRAGRLAPTPGRHKNTITAAA